MPGDASFSRHGVASLAAKCLVSPSPPPNSPLITIFFKAHRVSILVSSVLRYYQLSGVGSPGNKLTRTEHTCVPQAAGSPFLSRAASRSGPLCARVPRGFQALFSPVPSLSSALGPAQPRHRHSPLPLYEPAAAGSWVANGCLRFPAIHWQDCVPLIYSFFFFS